jgi:hypothetical protein
MISRIINFRGKRALSSLVGLLALGVCAGPILGPVEQALAKGPLSSHGYQAGRGHQSGPSKGRPTVGAAPNRSPSSRPAQLHVAPRRPAQNHVAPRRAAPKRPAQLHVAPRRTAPSRSRPNYVKQNRHSRGRRVPGIVNLLPRGHGKAHYKGRPYYFHGGRFYRPYGRRYIVVPPPRRLIVPWLPIGCATLLIAGITYFTYLGVYYQRVPTGYMVVAPPAGAPPPVVSPSYSSVTVISAALNVRQGPGSNYPVLYVVNLGDTLSVLASAPGWLYVQTATGQQGWVDQRFTNPFAPGASG